MVKAVQELLRQQTAQDSKFLQSLLYYFELRVPSEAAPQVAAAGRTANFFFPLILSPDQISIDEPFSVSETATQNAGLYVERNGIISRTIHIRGTTGFEPRQFLGSAFHLISPSDGRRGHNRPALSASMPKAVAGLTFSGQKQFQFLQDVFRLYSDLVQNKRFAEETSLIWHNPKDDEHWLVEPRQFTSDRDAGSTRVTYPYDIELLAYAPAEDANRSFSEEKALLEQIRDAVRMVNSAIQLVRGAIQDIQGVVADLDNLVSGIANTISNITGIVNDVASFINGVTDFVLSPIDAVTSVTTSLAQHLENLAASVTSIPDKAFQSLRQMQDGMDRLRQFPQIFESSTQADLRRLKDIAALSTSTSRDVLDAIALDAPPNSFQAMLAAGTANTPGDALTARAELRLDVPLENYRSAREQPVASGDTLMSLAATHLGDARKWRALAVLNNLRPPYISATGVPGTLTVGGTILIPSTALPASSVDLTPVLGVDPAESNADRLLGEDFKLVRASGPGNQVDFAIDTEGGSVDFAHVSGVQNLVQACLTRLEVEKGTNQLFQNVGTNAVVSTGNAALDKEVGLFHLSQAVLEDPRIVAVQNLQVRPSSSDSLVVDLDAVPVNFSESIAINVEVA